MGSYVCLKHLKDRVTSSSGFANQLDIPEANELYLQSSYEPIEINNNEESFMNNNEANTNCFENKNAEKPYLFVDLPRTYASHAFCFICRKKSGKYHYSKLKFCKMQNILLNQLNKIT